MNEALAATQLVTIFETPTWSHQLRLVAIDHSVSEQSRLFEARFLIELEHGDV